jgi:hypothetical protein
MKKCNPGAKCGISFSDNDEVVLYWTISLTRIYELTFKERQLTVECNSFQRAMKQAELDMTN